MDTHSKAVALYRSVGFTLIEERPALLWGVERLEQRHEMEV
jgi:hypothetical protein